MKSFFAKAILFTLSFSTNAAENEFIPQKHVLKYAPEKFVDELRYINQTTTYENLVLCSTKEFDSGCQATSLVKYAMDPFTYIITPVKLAEGKLIGRKVAGAEEIYISRLQQYMLDGKLEAEKHSSNVKKLKGLGEFKILSEKHCGSGWSEGITPELFPNSCQAHDNCYSSGNPKVVCDDAFLRNMQDEAYGQPGYTSRLLDALTFYSAVQKLDAAFDAFCDATPNPSEHAECDPELHDYLSDNLTASGDTKNGSYTGANVGATVPRFNSGGDGGVLVPTAWSCELWRFSDGNSGSYTMARNCRYSR